MPAILADLLRGGWPVDGHMLAGDLVDRDGLSGGGLGMASGWKTLLVLGITRGVQVVRPIFPRLLIHEIILYS